MAIFAPTKIYFIVAVILESHLYAATQTTLKNSIFTSSESCLNYPLMGDENDFNYYWLEREEKLTDAMLQ